MPASFLHGVEVLELETGPAPITVVKSSVIGLVGTAPCWALPSLAAVPGINAPTLVGSPQDAVQFGPAVQGYTIPYALNAILGQGAGQIIVVNVFDNTKHTSDIVASQTFTAAGAINLGHMRVTQVTVMPTTTAPVTGESHTFGGTPATIQLAHGNIQASSMVVTSNPAGTTYVQGTDYLVDARTGLVTRVAGGGIGATAAVLASYSYYSGTHYTAQTDYAADCVNGVLTLLTGSAIAAGATVIVSFSYADPRKVQDSDIIGTVSSAG
jgi:uncharacterized protein